MPDQRRPWTPGPAAIVDPHPARFRIGRRWGTGHRWGSFNAPEPPVFVPGIESQQHWGRRSLRNMRRDEIPGPPPHKEIPRSISISLIAYLASRVVRQRGDTRGSRLSRRQSSEQSTCPECGVVQTMTTPCTTPHHALLNVGFNALSGDRTQEALVRICNRPLRDLFLFAPNNRLDAACLTYIVDSCKQNLSSGRRLMLDVTPPAHTHHL